MIMIEYDEFFGTVLEETESSPLSPHSPSALNHTFFSPYHIEL